MFQKFIIDKLLSSKLSGIPEEQREVIAGAIAKNPEFFKRIAQEVDKKKKEGRADMDAVREVMMEHQDELKRLLS